MVRSNVYIPGMTIVDGVTVRGTGANPWRSIPPRRRAGIGAMVVRLAALSGLAGALPACGGGNSTAHDGGADTMTLSDGCAPSDAGEPATVPAHVSYDGGVPIDRLAGALALVRCNYLAKCFSLASYVVRECVDQMTEGNQWVFSRSCTVTPGQTVCTSSLLGPPFPTAVQFDAIAAGQVTYDPQRESACLEALQAEGCVTKELFENLPACVGVFSCAAGAGDAGAPDGGAAADGGAGCSALPSTFTPVVPCATDNDCSDAGAPSVGGGPFCVGGYCFADSCGDFQSVACASLVGVGQACDANPPSLNGFNEETHTRFCSPGLVCQGLSGDGGVGVCATAQDIGGPCVEGAQITGCLSGLACECGVCRLPPTTGPCASGLCEVGVAYCDLTSNICRPVVQLGGACFDQEVPCAPNLQCDFATKTCQPM
jgi:hypothetical protein